MIKLIVGLGNPGQKYSKNIHNIGYMFVDKILQKYEHVNIGTKFNGIIFKVRINRTWVLIAKPLTFMNLSGDFVQQFTNYFNISYDEILVVYDDVSIDIGNFKIKLNGSSGGHNGIKSIIEKTGTEEIKRIKIGAGPIKDKIQITNYVLSNIPDSKMKIINMVINEIIQKIEENTFDQVYIGS